MAMRLGFSVAIHAEPNAFVIDEALSVGDAYFQQKCLNKINEFKSKGVSIVFVSHDVNAVNLLCDRAILLHEGEITDDGDTEKVIRSYFCALAMKNKDVHLRISASSASSASCSSDNTAAISYGNFKLEITHVEMLNSENEDSRVFYAGEAVKVRIHLNANKDVERNVVGILIRDRFGQDIFGTNTYHLNKVIAIEKGENVIYEYEFRLTLGLGHYGLTVSVHRDDNHISETYHWWDNVLSFEVAGSTDYAFIGVSKLEVRLNIYR
ncbi:sugar ABC transporter ATP-binding protein [Candidatus Magnetoovum chiemensis]|nr:sugar ABC transporter ATP-binding protein [Candidatus Magnetoovum chiemensis]